MKKIKLLFDNGHGESTKGKRSPDGRLREYMYAREIVKDIVTELRRAGYDAEALVPENADIPITERCNRANAVCDRVGTDGVLLVSVHVNAAGDGSKWLNARGWEAWTSPGRTKADNLAECLYDAATDNLPAGTSIRVDTSDGDRDKEARFGILTGTRCPAVLTENLFQDNKEDVDYLLSDSGRKAIVKLHVDAVCTYLKGIAR